MRSRHSGLLRGALLSLIGCLGWATPGLADHDRIPDPPPRFTGQKLQAVPKLDGTAITVSGLSSGGFFAHQFHIAFSKLVTGAGIIAGDPFGCMESIPNPYFWFWTVPLDRVSAATLAYSHYFGDRYFGLRPSPPRAVFVVTLPGGRYTLPFSSVTVRAGLVTMTAPGLLPPGPPWSAPRSSSARPRRAPELLQRAGSTTRANEAQLG